MGELHSLTDWQVSEASEDAELEDFCHAEVGRQADRAGRPEERREQIWSQDQHAGGGPIQHPPRALQGHGRERLHWNILPRVHFTGTDLPYGPAQEPHILKMIDRTCCCWTWWTKEREILRMAVRYLA